ncbi:MAG: rRNA maturation RNase YbeY [Maricaulaceae bacterium]|jgi:probable rRNA maturation factor
MSAADAPVRQAPGVGVVVSAPGWSAADFDPEGLADRAVAAVNAEIGADANRPVAVAFADDAEIRALNRTYRNADKPTNVLAFPAVHPQMQPQAPAPLGDIILAYETVLREAEAAGLTLEARAAHMIVHGCLHLHGYDHQSDDDALTMQALEARSLARLGYPDPYEEKDV